MFFLLAFGFGLGELVDQSTDLPDGLTYLEFVAPGLIAATAMQLASFEASWPVLSAIKRPADTVFMLETREGGMLNGRDLHTFYRRNHGQDRDSMNIIMTDSHAELRTFRKVWAGDFSTKPPASIEWE